MAIAVGQHTSASTTGASAVTGNLTTQASGSVIVLICGYSSGGFTSVSDSKSNSYTTAVAEIADASMGAAARILYKENATGGATHNFTLTATAGSLLVVEITGAKTSGALDKAPIGLVDTASPFTSTSTGTLTQAAELAVGGIVSNAGGTASFTAGASFTRQDQITDGTQFWCSALGTLITAATTAINTSWTEAGTSRSLNLIATFMEAAAGDTLMGRSFYEFAEAPRWRSHDR
jgi:hypothetical protein